MSSCLLMEVKCKYFLHAAEKYLTCCPLELVTTARTGSMESGRFTLPGAVSA